MVQVTWLLCAECQVSFCSRFMIKKITLLLIMFAGLCHCAYSGDTTLYVSAGGKGDGSKLRPASLPDAVSRLGQLKKLHDRGTITIILEDGIYRLNEPLRITVDNGGTPELSIVFKADKDAHPVISGGRRILMKGKRILSADISHLIKEGVPQDIYVNGKRAVRARTPNFGLLPFEKVAEAALPGSTGNKAVSVQYFEIPPATYQQLKRLTPQQLKKVRFNIYHKWTTTSRTIDSLSKEAPAFYATGPAWPSYNKIDKKSLFFLENDPLALDSEQEWVLDENNIVRYLPEDSSVDELAAVIPVVEKLLIIQGDDDEPVWNVSFEGISFCYANKVFHGFDDSQAASSIDAALMVDHARNIRFERCRITHTGQYGIWFRRDAKYCSMRQCYINDLGAGGVRIGETNLPEDTAHLTAHINIENCIIHSGGYNYPPAVGVFIAHAADNVVAHNDIGDFRYTGVSVGWVWGYSHSPSVNNKIIYNHIHHIGWGVLSDMAGVYTLGISPGTEVSHNVIHDVYSYDYGGWGLYTDEGSTGIRMEDNLVYHTKTGSFHQHYGRNNIIDNNIFAFSKKYLAQDSRIEDHLSFVFKHNILLSGGEPFFQGCWKTGRVEIDSNCYWIMGKQRPPFMISTRDYGGKPVDSLNFSQWQSAGKDGYSLFRNPEFKDARHYDFELADTALTRRIGFVPFDYKKAGVTGSHEWKAMARLSDEVIRKFDKSVQMMMLE